MKHRVSLFLMLCCAMSLALRLAFINEPFERDEGFYSAIALQILDGAIPYRDTFEPKGPLLFYLYAFGLSVMGESMAAFRVFTALYNLLTLLGVYLLAHEAAGKRAGLLSAAIFAIFSSVPMTQASGSNAEVFLIMPMTWGAWLIALWFRSGKAVHLVLAGLCSVAALLIKMVAAPLVFAMMLAIIGYADARRSTLRALATYLLPQVAVVALTVFLLFLGDALDGFFRYSILASFRYVTESGAIVITGPALPKTLAIIGKEILPISVLGFLLLFSLPWTATTPALRWCAILPYVALAIALLPGKNFPHYFINVIPFLAVATGTAIVIAAQHRRFRYLPLLPALLLVHLIFSEHRMYWQMTPEEVSYAKYGEHQFVIARDIGKLLRKNTLPGETVFQWGFEPQIYLISGRPPPSRFFSSGDLGGQPDREAARQELRRDLESRPPRYVVIFLDWALFPGQDVLLQFMHQRGYQLEHEWPKIAKVYRRISEY